MFEWVDNILCVHASWLYGDGAIMSQSCYKLLVHRGSIEVVRRACRNRPALVAYESLPERFKSAIEEKIGNPYKKVEENEVLKYMKEVPAALKFYREYRYGEDKPLPSETIREYYADVQVMTAIGEVLATRKANRAKLGRENMGDVWKKITEAVSKLPRNRYPHKLPENDRRLKERFQDYQREGFGLFIHKGFGNTNTEKLNDQVKLWILARWANNIDRVTSEQHMMDVYNEHAREVRSRGGEEARLWQEVKSVNTIHNFLYSDGIRVLWYGARHGELKMKGKFMYQHSTLLPTMRDGLWYSDGTKLNFYYRKEDGTIATTGVYEVMDVYSEVFIGYAFCDTENFQAQRAAFKMALQFAGEKPYQISFDNQGGHKKMGTTSFITRLANVAIKTKPYNGQSKTIESAFGRFQSMVMKKRGLIFTGQNITSKREESKANLEFILANKDNIPTLEEVRAIYLECREEWNNANHPGSGLPRSRMYRESRNEELVPVGRMDLIELFCEEHPAPVRVTPGGLSFEVNKVKYNFMVNDRDNLPDVEWIADHIDKKYVVKYDPDDMNEIHLFEKGKNGLAHVKTAVPKTTPHRGKQEQEDWEAKFFTDVERRIKDTRIKKRDIMDGILEAHGLLPEQHGLNSPPLKGIESSRAAKSTTPVKHRKRKQERTKGIAEIQKEISNVVAIGGGEDEIDSVLDKFNDRFPVEREKNLYDLM